MLHKFPIRKVMPILGVLAIVHFANSRLIIPTNMHTFPSFRWCRVRYNIIYLLQADILDCRLQHQATFVAIGFFVLVILYECCVATLGASPNCFCSNQCIPSPYIFNTDSWVLNSFMRYFMTLKVYIEVGEAVRYEHNYTTIFRLTNI